MKNIATVILFLLTFSNVVMAEYSQGSILKNSLSYQATITRDIWGVPHVYGKRDEDARTKMAKIASKYTDIQIITDDNPRNENPSDIRRILIESSSNPLEIPSRKKAIERGVKLLKIKKGLLIITGKGHENSQIYKDKIFTFNDRLVAKSYAKFL